MTRKHSREPGSRQLRVGEEIRHALADVFERGDMHDPDLRDTRVTVTEVRLSPDLKNATAFVTRLGGGGTETLIAALGRAAPYFRRQLAEKLRLRFVPRLLFKFDTTFDDADHLDDLLRRTVGKSGGDSGPESENGPQSENGEA
jgi:ribosome-binding factor A